MKIQMDKNTQPYIEWEQPGLRLKREQIAYKRVWIQKRDGDGDWAGTDRYLNVAWCNKLGGRTGPPVDFPIYNQLPHEQILQAFVYATNAITGLPNWDNLV